MKAYFFRRIFRLLFLLVLLGTQQEVSIAQDVILNTQSDVNNFDASTTVINGNLYIGVDMLSSTINDLTNLSNLETITENLTLRNNDNLTSLDGLNAVTEIGGTLSIYQNENITNLDGLSGVSTIGNSLSITYNRDLENINGLSSIISVGNYLNVNNNFNLTNVDGLSGISKIEASLSIASNFNLTNVNGLSSISIVEMDLTIESNNNLTNVDGLSSLTTVKEDLIIASNDNLLNLNGLGGLSSAFFLSIINNELLMNVDGLSSLTTVGRLTIYNNNNITNVNSLNGLNAVDGHVRISSNDNLINLDGMSGITIVGSMSISDNDLLLNINGLSNLTTVEGDLQLHKDTKLTNLDGLRNLISVGGDLLISDNTKLTNLDGLRRLISVGGDLYIHRNIILKDCCGIQTLLENQSSSISGEITISFNSLECNTEQVVLSANCGMHLTLASTPPCIDVDNGSIQVFVEDYKAIPFYYEWMRQEDGLTGNGVSDSDDFLIDMLGAGNYNITVTNTEPDTAIKLDIVLSQKDGHIFEIIEVKTTNSSNGLTNGSITLTTKGGREPYTYTWSGVASGSESGVATDFHTIPFLSYGEYIITVEDDAGSSKVVNISLLDETVQVIECEKPLDIVILNDVSGSVDAIEYMESKQFFVDFLQEVNIGPGADESRAAIIEWSSFNDQELKIPITGDMTTLSTYLDYSRSFSDNTAPHEAMEFGESYLGTNARPDVEKVIILSTDGSSGQISSSLIALADEFKANGYHIITIAFDNAFSNSSTRDILRKVASVDVLAPGAPAYSQLDADLARNIVFNYLCPIDPGSSATAYFNRDGAIDIIAVDPVGNCPFPDFVEVTIDISAYRELSIPAGTPVTFYHNNPNQSGATPILTWQIPCAIPIDSTETYTITLPMSGPSNIFAVLNDNGEQGPPISFPITEIEEIAYSNNIDNERICLDEEATIQAFKYSSLPIPSCDTIVNYTINVCNISEVDAFGVSVTDIAPPGFVLTGSIFNDNGCATNMGGTYDIPADCCFSLFLTYDASAAAYGYYGNQGVNLEGPFDQTHIDFDGSTTTDEDVTLDGSIDCPSTTIEFTKSVNIDESCDDGFVEFTFTINNEMNIPLQGLTFRDVLPDPCTWAYVPYGESGLSIANADVEGNEAIFTIDEVQANTVATFYMDASLNSWSNDGTLSNTATLENVPDVINGGFRTLTSNTTNTMITASPNITLPDTIIVNAVNDTVDIQAILSTIANVTWTTSGDGQFEDSSSESTKYFVGNQDALDGEVMLFISAESDCNETGASVLIQFVDCSLEVEIIEIGECDNMGTPLDGSDDTYDVKFMVSGDNVGQDSMFVISIGTYSDTLTYFTEHTLTLPLDGIEDILSFVDLDLLFCNTEIEVNQEICFEECSLLVDSLTISDCDDNGTPQDSTDDIYQIEFKILASNPSLDSTFTTLYNGQVEGPFSYGEVTSLTLSADSELDSIWVADTNIDTCGIWIDVNQENCFTEPICSISIDGLTTSVCFDNETPQDSTDDIYQLEFTAFASNPSIDSAYTTNYGGQVIGPIIFGDVTSITLSADSELDSIWVSDTNDNTCGVWVVVNQENCYSDPTCLMSIDVLTISDCDDNGTPQDSTDDIYNVDFFVESDTTYHIIQEMNIFGPFENNTQASITLSADNIPDTLIFVAVGDENCIVEEVVNQNSCDTETTVIDSSEIIVPNVFSPNGDKINDEWFVTVTDENIKLLECSVFDRWGSIVFHSSDINPIWNGQYKQKPVVAGVYIYVLTYVDGSGLETKKVGDVTVIY